MEPVAYPKKLNGGPNVSTVPMVTYIWLVFYNTYINNFKMLRVGSGWEP